MNEWIKLIKMDLKYYYIGQKIFQINAVIWNVLLIKES